MADSAASSSSDITMCVCSCPRHQLASLLCSPPSSTVKGPSELKLSITISPSKTVADLKEAIAAKSDVEKDRQRLIYSGL